MLAAAILPGVLIGAALGFLGGGGSVLTVPIFVYGLGFAPKPAVAMSLAVVAATSAFGSVRHWRVGNVNWRIALQFGIVAMLGTTIGTRLARGLTGTTQLVGFAVVMLAAAAFMAGERGARTDRPQLRSFAFAKVAPAGLAVGVLTGLVGVGGGFLIVPALVLMGTSLREAIGTSLLIITGTCVVGFVGYLGQVPLDWTAVGLVAVGTLPGIAIGTHLHRFVPPQILRRGFAGFLVLIALLILFERAAPAIAAALRG